MKRRKPLRRKTWLRSRSRTSAYRRRPRDLAYLRAVKTFPCVVPELIHEHWRTPCSGPVEADHVGRRGLGQKCPDRESASLCRGHHRERTHHYGTFADYDPASMRTFCDHAMALTASRIAERERIAKEKA